MSAALIATAAGARALLLAGYEPAWPGASASGPALTVRGAPGDNLALHRALDAVRPGEMIVIDAGGGTQTAICGELIALAARERGAAGIVVNGPVRDRVDLEQVGLPVFHRGTCPAAPRKDVPGELRVPVLGIEPGDLVVADPDGVVAVAAAHVDEVLAAAAALDEQDASRRSRIAAGERPLDVFDLRP